MPPAPCGVAVGEVEWARSPLGPTVRTGWDVEGADGSPIPRSTRVGGRPRATRWPHPQRLPVGGRVHVGRYPTCPGALYANGRDSPGRLAPMAALHPGCLAACGQAGRDAQPDPARERESLPRAVTSALYRHLPTSGHSAVADRKTGGFLDSITYNQTSAGSVANGCGRAHWP